MASTNEDSQSDNEDRMAAVEKPTKDLIDKELGVDAQLPFATPFQDTTKYGKVKSELTEVGNYDSEENGPNVIQLNTMRRMDGQVRALYRLVTLPLKAALKNATFIPEDGGEAEADFIDQVFNTPPASGGMTVTMHRFMSQLLSGLYSGFAAFEQVYWQPKFGPLQGKYTLKKLAFRPPETISFVQTDKGGFAGFRQRSWIGGKTVDVFIPAEKAFYYAAQEEERKFYGVSFFQTAFYHYDKKVRLYYAAHLAAQRAAVGTRVGTYPLNASKADKQNFINALNNLSFAQYMAVPENFKVEILKEGGNFDFIQMIDHHNTAMSKSVLANFFDQDSSGGAGGDAAIQINNSGPNDEMFTLMLGAIQDDIANSINHYVIPRLIDWNFGTGKYPKFAWGALTDDQKALISATFNKLATAQSVTPEFQRELEKIMAKEMNLEIDYDQIEADEEEERQKLEEQQAQMADQEMNVDQSLEPEEEEGKFEQSIAKLSREGIPERYDTSIISLAQSFLDEARDKLQ